MLRHSRQDIVLCRKRTGATPGYVCSHHEGHCVLCDIGFDDITPTMRPVFLCDDCGLAGESGGDQCIMCGRREITERAFYCHYCVAMQKDRDGCPRALNMLGQQRIAAIRSAMEAQAKNS